VDDRRKRQTFAATPQSPGDPPAPSEVALEIRRRVLADQDQRFDRRPAAHRQRTADIRPGGEPNGASGLPAAPMTRHAQLTWLRSLNIHAWKI
jgi:hypothetical protein